MDYRYSALGTARFEPTYPCKSVAFLLVTSLIIWALVSLNSVPSVAWPANSDPLSDPDDEGDAAEAIHEDLAVVVPRAIASYDVFIPAAASPSTRVIPGTFEEVFPDPFSGECHPFKVCDEGDCADADKEPPKSFYNIEGKPERTIWGERTEDFIQRVLEKAWIAKTDLPKLDLYVRRAGCYRRRELLFLFQSVQLFWPRFLGEILFIVDFGTDVSRLLTEGLRQNFALRVVYEHLPCLEPRLFNQYSYLNAYRYSSDAEIIVTIDSDCVLHRPVTPDVLFNDKALLLVPTHQYFQRPLWGPSQALFTGLDSGPWGTAMVSQPVAFRSESFRDFFPFVMQQKHTCYEALLAQENHHHYGFCWMCQLVTFVAALRKPGYEIYVANLHHEDAYIRYAAHIPYESNGKYDPGVIRRDQHVGRYRDSVSNATTQGLCFWFGTQVFAECTRKTNFAYLERLLLKYAGFKLNSMTPRWVWEAKLKEIHSRLTAVVTAVKASYVA